MDAAAERWMRAELAAAGRQVTGALDERRERPWGSVVRVPTSGGPLWLKAAAPATAFEAAIYAELAAAAPAHVLAPVALAPQRGWMLLPDGGPPLGQEAEGDALVEAMAGALAAYGELQRQVAGRVDVLLAADVADMRPGTLVARFDEALAAFSDPPPALSDIRPQVVDWCATLAQAPGLATLDHNDLHPWNMLDGGRRFYDWGDAVIAHPFACLLMPLAKIARAHTWERALRAAPPGDPLRERFASAPLEALTGLLGEPWDRPL